MVHKTFESLCIPKGTQPKTHELDVGHWNEEESWRPANKCADCFGNEGGGWQDYCDLARAA